MPDDPKPPSSGGRASNQPKEVTRGQLRSTSPSTQGKAASDPPVDKPCAYCGASIVNAMKVAAARRDHEWVLGFANALGGPEAISAQSAMAMAVPEDPSAVGEALKQFAVLVLADAEGKNAAAQQRLQSMELRIRQLEAKVRDGKENRTVGGTESKA